jgi:hypothetical protein
VGEKGGSEMNLVGAEFRSLQNGDEEVTLPVFVGKVVGVGFSLEAAIKDAKAKLAVEETFAVEAIRVRREVLRG